MFVAILRFFFIKLSLLLFSPKSCHLNFFHEFINMKWFPLIRARFSQSILIYPWEKKEFKLLLLTVNIMSNMQYIQGKKCLFQRQIAIWGMFCRIFLVLCMCSLQFFTFFMINVFCTYTIILTESVVREWNSWASERSILSWFLLIWFLQIEMEITSLRDRTVNRVIWQMCYTHDYVLSHWR